MRSFSPTLRHIALILIAIAILAGQYKFLSPHVQGANRINSPLPTPTPVVSPYGKFALEYLSKKYNTPIESLSIEYQIEENYPLSGHTFVHFKISNTLALPSPTYSVFVDMATNAIEEDGAAIEHAENEAYLAKYGKLDTTLYNRLQHVANDTVLPVAIWAAGSPTRTEDEIIAILASEFPEAAKAIADGTKPTDVGNPELSQKIQIRYEELLNQNVDTRLKPIQDWLRQAGYSYEMIAGMPSLTTTLPKATILKLAQLKEVGMLYLIEEKAVPAMDIVVPTDRVTTIWQRGFTGNGIRVAVLDVNRVDTPCLNIVATNNPALLIAPHATKMANVVACNTDP